MKQKTLTQKDAEIVNQANGATYQGALKDGQKNGHGIQVWPDTSRYEG